MGKRVTETERKYETPVGDAGGCGEYGLEGLPGVAEVLNPEPDRLDAVYYDTAGLALGAHRTTLRRRKGGQDAGWHLKLPTTRADTRTEVHAPLGPSSGMPPEELRTEVAAIVRGRALRPVVRLRTVRRRTLLVDPAGRTLAEIAHDDVRAELRKKDAGTGAGRKADRPWSSGPAWTETEVELGEGAGTELLDAVEERLLAAGMHRSSSASKLAHALGDRLVTLPRPQLPPQTAGQTATAYLHEQLAALLALDPAVRRAEEDAVHRMRVATRRARSALKSFGHELDRKATDPLGLELKWLAGVLGLERDREVLTERISQRLAELDPALVVKALKRRLRAPRATGPSPHETLVGELDGARYFALLDGLESLLAAPPYRRPAADEPARSAAAATVRRDHTRLRAAIGTALALAPGDERDTSLHDARKDAKRARYSSEAAASVLGKRATAHGARMKAIQQLLGEHQDSYLCRSALAPLRAQAVAAGEDPAPYDVMMHRERDLATAVEAALPAAWQSADQPV